MFVTTRAAGLFIVLSLIFFHITASTFAFWSTLRVSTVRLTAPLSCWA